MCVCVPLVYCIVRLHVCVHTLLLTYLFLSLSFISPTPPLTPLSTCYLAISSRVIPPSPSPHVILSPPSLSFPTCYPPSSLPPPSPGFDPSGQPVFLRDIWPSREELQEVERKHVLPAMFKEVYAKITHGNESWNQLRAPNSQLYPWNETSTYIKSPPFFDKMVR